MTNSAIQLQPGEDGARGAPSVRNKVMNGQFDVWQRTLSFPPPPGSPAGGIGIAADRWSWQSTPDGGTFDLGDVGMARGDGADPGDPSTFGIDGDPRHFMRFQSDLTGTSGNAATNLVQRIERVEHFNGEQATLSFWARTEGLEGPTGTIAVSLLQFFGSGGSLPVTIPADVDITLTTTWTYYTLTFDVLSIAGKTVASNNDSLRVRFHNHIDAAIATSLGFVGPIAFKDVLNITNVQLELGPNASSYEIQNENTVLGACQRYYSKSYDQGVFAGAGTPGSPERGGEQYLEANGTGGTVNVRYPVTMRAIPSITLFGPDGTPTQAFDVIGFVTGLSLSIIGEASASVIYGIVGVPAVDGLSYSYHYTADSEL